MSGMTVDRQCASGLMAIATAAKQVVADGMQRSSWAAASSRSVWCRMSTCNGFRAADPTVMKLKPELYMAMLDTAEVVARRYDISRELQDVYSLESQRRTAAAQESGKFDAEILAITCQKAITNKDTGAVPSKRSRSQGRRQPRGHDARGVAQAQARFARRCTDAAGPTSPRATRASSPTARAPA